ncbi:MAG: glycosyltransferase family 39 protein [Cyanobacteria bacterium SZAS-4]|nr:glycosyltransferase family 39 protein [Cyanobacteria bacterium SZAS-4]
MLEQMRISRQLLLIIFVYFLTRLPWLFSVPMAEAPDEFSHYWVFRFMAEHLRLPSAVEVAAGGPSGVYGSLPQLGYIPHVLVCKILPIGDLSLVGRFGSLFAGLVAVVAAYFIGMEIFDVAAIALSLPLIMVFHPQLVFINSYSNSDTTACALTSLTLYLCVRILKAGLTTKKALLLGFLLGWTALTKYSGVALFPATLVALLTAFYIHKVSFGKGIQYLLIVGGTFAATCGWWFVHSMQEFNGDLLGTKTMRETWARTYNRPLEFHMPVSHVIKDKVFWSTVHDSFWGVFGYMTRFLWSQIYYTYLGFLLLAIAGGARALFTQLRGWKSESVNVTVNRERLTAPAIWCMFAILVFVNIAAMVVGASMNLGGAQGRYLLPSEIALLALLVGGLSKLGKIGNYLVIGLVAFNVVVVIGAFIMLINTKMPESAQRYGFTTKLY